VGPTTEHKRQHLAIYDYGMGGIWVLIDAESAEAIERRYPQLQVITIGRPAWVTAEKYDELVNGISSQMQFDLEHPTGWLAESDRGLSEPRPDES
jgi:hypothetical protein